MKIETVEVGIVLAGADEAIAKLDALASAAEAAARAFAGLRAAMGGVESNVTVTINPEGQAATVCAARSLQTQTLAQ